MSVATFPGNRPDALRVPPHSVEAEQAVLGALLIQPKAWFEVCDVLTESDFYRRDHQEIFRGIRALMDARKPLDVVVLSEWFDAAGLSDRIEGGNYLLTLTANTASAANARTYADIVADKSRLRRMIDVGTQLANDAYCAGSKSSVELVGVAQSRMADLLANEPCELEPVGPVMVRSYERLTERFNSPVHARGLSWGLTELDDITGGLHPGQLVILAARPKMGKTTMAQNIAEHCALTACKPVAFFSFEMQPVELTDRMICNLADINGSNFNRGTLENHEWSAVTEAMQRVRSAPLFLSKPRSARVEHVVAQLRRQHARTPLGLVVVDYLQLLQTYGDNRAQGLGDVTRTLKLTAAELGLPILLLSQLNRDLEKRPDKRPTPADLRDSGSIEQDADLVVFIYRDEIYKPESRDRGTAEINVALQRNGPSDMARALYQPERFRFSDLPPGWMPEPEPEKPAKRSGFKGAAVADHRAGLDS